MTINKYTLKDSYDTATRIRNIPTELFDQGYVFVSFDVVSLFTNVPLQLTTNIILNRVYNEQPVETNLKKSTLKKLIKDTCMKTVFSCNNQLYEQTDGVSMGSSMGPLLANIIMTELEKVIITPLVDDGTIKFYGRYVDDTLLLVKPTDIDRIHQKLNTFDKNIQFTVDKFETETPHFLDIEISPDGLSIYRKDTNTGQYINFTSHTPWKYKVSWIISLLTRAKRLCSDNKLDFELDLIRRFASWNSFPKHICEGLISRVFQNNVHRQPIDTNRKEETEIWLKLTYHGTQCEQLLQKLERKLRRSIRSNKKMRFKVIFSTNKISFYTNMKDKTPLLLRSYVVYHFVCPGCRSDYIGKTDGNLHERCIEHATSNKDKSRNTAIYDHLLNCEELRYMTNLLHHGIGKLTKAETRDYYLNCIVNNIKVIDTASNWNILLLKEALHIKRKSPFLNHGLKASRELFLFS